MSAMVECNGMSRGPLHSPSDFTPWTANAITKACLITTILMIMAVIPAQGAEWNPRTLPLTPGSPLTFAEGVKIAIHQSPYFTKSSLELEVKRMDESDSRFGMAPNLSFRTIYYVNRPEDIGLSSRPYSLSFTTDPYNPIGSYLTLQAQKLATQIAILKHLKLISGGLERLGVYYLELDALKKMAAYQRELVNLNRENLTYAENRMSIGTGTTMEVKLAQQELQLALGELEQIAITQKRYLTSLRNFLGLASTAEFNPDFHDSRKQVLGDFNPASTTLEQVENHSYEMKALDIQRKLQKYNISLAVIRIFPNLLFTTQTPDPLSVTSARGLYVGFGLDIPVWDGFKRIRNVSRQKVILKQVDAQKEEKKNSLEDKWLEAKSNINEKGTDLKIAKAREELARLKAQQHDVRYQSGEITLPVALESRKQVLTAQKDTVIKNLEYDKAVLQLREVSGDLGHTYVDASSWQK